MKIILTCPRTPRLYHTGLENLTLSLAKALAAEGLDIEIFTTAPEPLEGAKVGGIAVREFRGIVLNESYFFSKGLFDAIRSSNADIVQAQGYNNLVSLLALMAKRQGQKFVFYLCASGASSPLRKALRGIFDLAVRAYSGNVGLVIYSGEDERHIFGRLFPRAQSMVFPPPVELEKIHSAKARQQKNRLICVGRMVNTKGYPNLLPSFALAVKKNSLARLVIVGDGPMRAEYERMSLELGIAKNVEFIGTVSHGEYIIELKKSSAIVLLLEFTNISSVVCEALAAKIPVIASADSIPEYSRKGYVVPVNPQNHGEVAQAILDVLTSPKKFVAKNPPVYSWKQIGKRLAATYKKL